MAKFIVLRTGQPEGHRSGSAPTAPLIDIADLSASDLRETDRDPAVIAVARSMPTQLIEPEPLDDIRPDEAVPGWGLTAVGAETCPVTGSGVRVAVLDTGVDADHPAFAGVTLERCDFAGSGDDDAHGHGTHFTGTVLGRAVEGTRIGVAPGVTEALIGKVLTDDGHGTTAMLIRGLAWALRARAQVIALSLAFDLTSLVQALIGEEDLPQLLASAVALESYRDNLALVEALIAQPQAGAGTVILAAAGNDSRRTVSPDFEVGTPAPATACGVMPVGALSNGDEGLAPAPFSNTRPGVAAPGGAVMSAALGGGLRALNGTSMACAHAAGVAALWWAHLDRSEPATAAEVTRRMLADARRDGPLAALSPLDIGQGLVRAPG
ncbi:S8 family serine peptidase [Thalassococcus sp. BH17M4-6]|uniref:S8 family serine peptidase n=1 Tax=Thalassococcus sp. BH17M4-6 TaxID=3413148 RepID=UPI003BC85CD8